MPSTLGPGAALGRGRLALAGAGLALAASCASPTESLRTHAASAPDPWALPEAGAHARDPARPALVIHSAGLDALLADPRDAGLRRALALVDERLLELPAEVDGFTPPPGLVEFLGEFLGSPWTLELDVQESGGGDGGLPVGVRARWTVQAANAERAAALETRFAGLLASIGFSSSADSAGFAEVLTPAGSLFHGARPGACSFVVAWGEPAGEAAAPSALELPAGTTPVLTLELELSQLVKPFEGLLALADPSGNLRRQLEASGLLGGAALGVDLAIGHASDRAYLVSRYRNWAGMARASGALVAEPLPREALDLVPADATMVSLSRSEPLAILRALERFGTAEDAELQALVRAELGFDLGPDLLEPLGQTLGFYLSDSTGGGGLASAVLFVALDDEDRLERTLEEFAERLNDHAMEVLDGRLRVRSFLHRGTPCLGLTVPGIPLPFEPALAIRRRHLFVGATPQALAGALDHARGDAPGLRAHPGLRALAPGPLDDLQGLFFGDVPRLARDGYGLAALAASALANGVRSSTDGLREPGLVLPPYGELVAGARPTLVLARIQGEDLVTLGQADRSAALHLAATLGWAPSVIGGLTLGAGLFAGLTQRQIEEVQWEETAEMTAQADVWALMNALHSYAIQHSGRYPESLDALVVPDENGFTFLNRETLPLDPWSRSYLYELSGNEPHVYSYGADGVPGGEGPDRDVDSLELEADLGEESAADEDVEVDVQVIEPEAEGPEDEPKG